MEDGSWEHSKNVIHKKNKKKNKEEKKKKEKDKKEKKSHKNKKEKDKKGTRNPGSFFSQDSRCSQTIENLISHIVAGFSSPTDDLGPSYGRFTAA